MPGRQPLPRDPLGLGGREHAGAQLVADGAVRAGGDLGEHAEQHVQGGHRAAAVDPGVQVAGGGAHLDVRHREAAQPDRDRGRLLVDHAGVEHDRRVGEALVGLDPRGDALAARLLLALDHDAHVDRQLAGLREVAGRRQQRPEVALVVAGPAGVDAPVAHLGLERRRRPRAQVARALDVVVAVDEDGRGVGAVGLQVADGERVAVADRDELRRSPRALDVVGGPLGGAPDLGRVAAARRDRRDPQPLDELLEEVGHARAH